MIDLVDRYQALQEDVMAGPVDCDTQALARLGFRYSQLRTPKSDRIVKEGTGRSYFPVGDELVDRGDCPKHILTFVSRCRSL